MTSDPGVSIAQARETMRYQDSVLASFPEVASVFGKGGMITSAILTLVVIPAIYYVWRAWQVRRWRRPNPRN